MPQGPIKNDLRLPTLIDLHEFKGHPGKFWPAFLEFAAQQAEANAALLLKQKKQPGEWKTLLAWPDIPSKKLQSDGFQSSIQQLADRSAASSNTVIVSPVTKTDTSSSACLGLRLHTDNQNDVYVCIFIYDNLSSQMADEYSKRLPLIADTPAIYFRSRKLERAAGDSGQFAEALDLMFLINNEKKYMAAAMTFCNEIASRYDSSRVSFGWLESGYIRLQSISHMERFEKKMDIVQNLEAAMEEAFDQDEEILWPKPETTSAICRDHETFSKKQGVEFMVSLPLRLAGETVGVLTCERDAQHFSEKEVRGLRLLCDQAIRRLGDLKESDKWIGARCASSLRKGASWLLGVEHTFAKCMALIGVCVLGFLFFGQLPYRIEAPFILKSDDVRFLPAPFEGYIDEVHVEAGVRVAQEDLLLILDTNKLLLEESAALANQIRYSREAEKARAANALAEMKISMALAEQAKAQLDLVRYHLSKAEIKAPFNGIVVEGDFEELLGAPVKKGDVLFKISRIEKMHAELEFSERNIHEISLGDTVEIAFVSQPQLKYPAEIFRIDPVAVAKEEGNVFLVHCSFRQGLEVWWRPGMSGVAKASLNKRNALWVLSHRTVDFFRIALWW